MIQLEPHNKNTNLWLHLASYELADSQLRIDSKTEMSVAQAQNYIGGGKGGDTPSKKLVLEGGRQYDSTCLFDEGNNWGVDTSQHCALALGGLVGGLS